MTRVIQCKGWRTGQRIENMKTKRKRMIWNATLYFFMLKLPSWSSCRFEFKKQEWVIYEQHLEMKITREPEMRRRNRVAFYDSKQLLESKGFCCENNNIQQYLCGCAFWVMLPIHFKIWQRNNNTVDFILKWTNVFKT